MPRTLSSSEPAKAPVVSSDALEAFLEEVRGCMVDYLTGTRLRFAADQCRELMGAGKLLRSRLVWHVGSVSGTSRKLLVAAAAAVEMIHTASILHDDVIDGGMLRRGAPTFWVERGAAGAILLGDLLLFKAVDLMHTVGGGTLAHELVKLTGEVCEAESEQELVFQGRPSSLELCESIARRKTGALFAFAAVAAVSTASKDAVEASREAGYRLGTAYQLADDLLDAIGDPEAAGKTLGTDQARGIISAANLNPDTDGDPQEFIRQHCSDAVKQVGDWPELQQGFENYVEVELEPALQKLLAPASSH